MKVYYPPLGFHFKVSFHGITTIALDSNFQSVSGLTSELVTENYKEGGQNQFDYELPLKTQYPDLVLKRGLLAPRTEGDFDAPNDLQQWCQEIMQTLLVRPANVTVTLLNPKGEPLMAWNVIRAWPKKWQLGDFNAEENQIVIETMELHYDYFKIIK